MDQQSEYLAAFDEYSDALFRHAFFRVRNKEIALDLTQDAFTKTWDYLVKGNQIDQFKPFLYRTLNNLIIDEYRRKSTESLDEILGEDEVNEGVFEELRTEGREEVELALDAERFKETLQLLPDQYKEVVVMRYVDGLMPQEIAEVTGETVNVISVRIHRGIAWLKKNLQDRL